MNDHTKAVGIDIGGTKTAVAAVDGDGTIVARTVFATEAEQGFARAIARMTAAVDSVLGEAHWSRSELSGVGIGCTGPVNAEQGVINNPYTLHSWTDCPIVSRMTDVFSLPAYLENDADAALLGESFAGTARGARRAVMLTLGTGVGGAATVDGKIYRGVLGEHPELGHIPIDATGETCYCGTAGCLESIASGTAIAAAGRAHHMAGSAEVFARAAAGDSSAIEILDRVRHALSVATWTLLHTFMPELIVLGGGVVDDHFAALVGPLDDAIKHTTMVPSGSVRIVKAQLGNDAGIVGAASLALRRTP